MTYVTAALAIVTALLVVLVTGLLRSHGEILRRLAVLDPDYDFERGEETKPGGLEVRTRETDDARLADGLPALPDRELPAAHEIAGEALAGGPVVVGFRSGGAGTLLAFLSSGCLTCEDFWKAFRNGAAADLPDGARLVIVTKDRMEESPSRLSELTPASVPLVMSSRAFADYGVTGSPYFVYVDGAHARVTGEGSALSWKQVQSLLKDAVFDAGLDRRAQRRRRGPHVETPEELWRRGEETLARHGIGPGHPSLYNLSSESHEDR